ncbi:MAG: NnrS family protein [Rhizobiaceae bacterium]
MPTTTANAIRSYEGPALFARGFRPFFLGAALFAALAVPAWIVMLAQGLSPHAILSARDLHMHEMAFGYTSAVIAGFLLTATPNWTGRLPVTGVPLAGLFALWLAGRIAMDLPLLPPLAIAVVDASFLVVFSGLLWREILAAGNLRNLPVCLIVTLFAAANVWFHALALGGGDADIAVRAALGSVAVLITVIGGRIVPSFTRNWLARNQASALPAAFSGFDKLVLACGVVAVASWIVVPDNHWTGILALIAGFLHLARVARWRGWLTFAEPLVTILHVGYLWLPVWLLLVSASILGDWLDASAASHALTAGAIGTMTVAMMSRAILGHSGRPLTAGKGIVTIYLMIVAAAAIRIVAGIVAADYMVVLTVAAALWFGGFALFAWIFTPMCTRPRVAG